MLCAFDFAGCLRELPLSEFFRLTRVGQISLGAFDVLKCFSDVGVILAAGASYCRLRCSTRRSSRDFDFYIRNVS